MFAAASQCGAVFHDHPRYFSQGLPLSSPDEMGDRARTAPPPCGAAHRASGHSGGARRQEGPATGGRIPPQSTDDAKTGLNRDSFGTVAHPAAPPDGRASAAGRDAAEERRRTTHHGRSAEMSTS